MVTRETLSALAIKLLILLSFLFTAGCNYEPLMVFTGKGDPDVVKTPEDSNPYFEFTVLDNKKNVIHKTYPQQVRLKLFNQYDSLLQEGYTDSEGKVLFNLLDEKTYPEGNYSVSSFLRDPVNGGVTDYSNTSFYYPGFPFSINKSIVIYPVR